MAVGDQKFELAISLYENVLDKFKPNDMRTEMFLSKAYFWKGDFEQAKKITLGLLNRFPNDSSLKFNLGLCLFEQASKTLRQLAIRRPSQTKQAIAYLKHAQKIFKLFSRNVESQLCFVKKLDMPTERAKAASVDVYNDLRESATTKIYMIDDLLDEAESSLAKD